MTSYIRPAFFTVNSVAFSPPCRFSEGVSGLRKLTYVFGFETISASFRKHYLILSITHEVGIPSTSNSEHTRTLLLGTTKSTFLISLMLNRTFGIFAEKPYSMKYPKRKLHARIERKKSNLYMVRPLVKKGRRVYSARKPLKSVIFLVRTFGESIFEILYVLEYVFRILTT